MEKPTIYIVVQEGLVQTVFVKDTYLANAEVVICDIDSTDNEVIVENEELEKQLIETAYQIY